MNSALGKRNIDVTVHLAIFVEPYLSAVLDGRKTIESRFAVHKRPPYLRVEAGDIIVLKRSGGPIMGVALAHTVRFYQLSPSVLDQLRDEFSDALFARDDAFWEKRREKHFATLIDLEDPAPVSPFSIPKRDRQAWVTYGGARDELLIRA